MPTIYVPMEFNGEKLTGQKEFIQHLFDRGAVSNGPILLRDMAGNKVMVATMEVEKL